MPSDARSSSRFGERVGLLLVLPRGGLVEQQHARLGGERASELDETRLPGRHRVDAIVGHAADADAVEDLLGHRSGVGLVAGPALADLGGGEDVLAGGQRTEHLEALERARDAAPGPLVRRAASRAPCRRG